MTDSQENKMKKIILPKTIFGAEVKGAMQRVLKSSKAGNSPKIEDITGKLNLNPKEYIQIPGIQSPRGNPVVISYLELQGYNNLNWDSTHLKLAENGLFMPTTRIFMKHFNNVVDAHDNKSRLYYSDGTEVERNKVEDLYNHLTKDHIAVYGFQAGAWCWLNDLFENQSGNWKVKHARVSNKSIEFDEETLNAPLRKDCYADFKDLTAQGFPKSKKGDSYSQGKNIYFYHPRDKSIAGFGAYSGRAGLDCNWDRSNSDEGLWVFGCAEGARIQGVSP